MKKIKILAFILACLMVLPVFTACGNKSEDATDTSVVTVDTSEDRLPLGVAPENNGGKDFNILLPTHDTLDFANEAGGTVVSQAVYNVDTKVEDHLGINIAYTQLDGNWANRATFNNRLLAMAMDSSSEFDLIMGETSASYAFALQNGLVMDITENEAIALDSPWYIADAVNSYGINGKLYGVMGDASLITYQSLHLVYVNDNMQSNYKLASPYEFVKNGTWDIEEMFTMAAAVETVSNEGIPSLDSDTFGCIAQHVASRAFMQAFNIELTEKSAEDGNTYMKTSLSESYIDMYDYMYDKFENNPSVYYCTLAAEKDAGWEAFKAGRALFYVGFFSHADSFRDTEWNWSVVPMPKWNEAQEDYCSAIGSQNMMFMIMKNANDEELSGKVLEVKSYYNHYEAVPAYYEDTLGYQYGRNQTHIEMLELIRRTGRLNYLNAMYLVMNPDPANLFQLDSYYRNEKVGGSATTYYKTNVTAWNSTLRNLYKNLG